MEIARIACAAALATFWPAVAALASGESLPWAFVGERADGYSIDLVTADPAPGTVVTAGAAVKFNITVSYDLSIAEHGMVVLVFQDDSNHSATAAKPQVTHGVARGKGTVSLSDVVTIPKNAKELRLFVPIVPDGIAHTKGEVTIRYPIATTQALPRGPLPEVEHSSIGYRTVAEALASLTDRKDVSISSERDWLIVTDEKNKAVWSFAPDSYPAHPAVVRRVARSRADGGSYIDMSVLCEATKEACDQLVREFDAMNRTI